MMKRILMVNCNVIGDLMESRDGGWLWDMGEGSGAYIYNGNTCPFAWKESINRGLYWPLQTLFKIDRRRNIRAEQMHVMYKIIKQTRYKFHYILVSICLYLYTRWYIFKPVYTKKRNLSGLVFFSVTFTWTYNIRQYAIVTKFEHFKIVALIRMRVFIEVCYNDCAWFGLHENGNLKTFFLELSL